MIKLAMTIGCLETGGAEIFVLNLLKRLDYRKYLVLLVVLGKKTDSFLTKEFEGLPIRIIYLNKRDEFSLIALIRMTKILRKFSPDIIHGNLGGMMYALPYLYLFRRKRAVHTAHTVADREYGSFKRFLLSRLYRQGRIIPVAISPYIRNSIASTYRLPKEKIVLINNAVDTRRFLAPPRAGTGSIVIGHVGRLEPVKNHCVILATFKVLLGKYPNLRLLLVGDGSLYSQIAREIEVLGDRAQIIKGTDKPEQYYAQIDIFLFPSVYEGMPLAVLEAMTAGCVIVASNTGGIGDLVTNSENGYLLDDCHDVSGFAGIIRSLLDNAKTIKAISAQNIEKAKRYDIEKLVDEYEKLYERVIADAYRGI